VKCGGKELFYLEFLKTGKMADIFVVLKHKMRIKNSLTSSREAPKVSDAYEAVYYGTN